MGKPLSLASYTLTGIPFFGFADSKALWIRIPKQHAGAIKQHAGAYLISQHKLNVYHDILRQGRERPEEAQGPAGAQMCCTGPRIHGCAGRGATGARHNAADDAEFVV
jgi:hypothetical protein